MILVSSERDCNPEFLIIFSGVKYVNWLFQVNSSSKILSNSPSKIRVLPYGSKRWIVLFL